MLHIKLKGIEQRTPCKYRYPLSYFLVLGEWMGIHFYVTVPIDLYREIVKKSSSLKPEGLDFLYFVFSIT